MIKNLIIYGSCVSRDIFNLEESRTFKLTDYFARCSMASLHSAPYENANALKRIPSEFRRRMVAYDFSKQILTETKKLKSADVILIDLIDERFDLVTLPTGHIITNSSELTESGLLSDINDYQLIKHGSDERRELWLQGMNKFLDLLDSHDKLQSVIINKVYWATRFEHPSESDFPVAPAATAKANQELDWMYRELAKKLEEHQFLEFAPDLLTADEFHQWGAPPFHYCKQYYSQALALLTTITTSNNSAGPSSIESSAVALPLVADGAKIIAAAYETESDIFAHCSLTVDGKIYENGNFAFYLLINGTRHASRWYEDSPAARFPISDISGEITVVAFYQDPSGKTISCQCSVKDFKHLQT